MATDNQVEFEHFAEALVGFKTSERFAEVAAGWVAEVILTQRENPAFQRCLAGVLCETGWRCFPPPEQADAETLAATLQKLGWTVSPPVSARRA